MRNKWYKNEKYEKLRNYLTKMKELNHVILVKGLFVSVKGHLFW